MNGISFHLTNAPAWACKGPTARPHWRKRWAQLRLFPLLLTSWLSLLSGAAVRAEVVRLPEECKFRFGDQLEWRQLDFDDSQWRTATIPQSWALELDSFYLQTRGWYRVPVQLSAEFPRTQNVVICVGVISDAAEIYVNGQLVGRHGKMAPSFDGSSTRPIRFDVPPAVLRPGRNLVAIRVHRGMYDGGIVAGPLLLGEAKGVLDELAVLDRNAWYFSGVVEALCVVPFFFALLLILLGGREREYVCLAVLTGVALASNVLESAMFLKVVGFGPMRYASVIFLTFAILPAAHLWAAAFLGRRVPRWLTLALATTPPIAACLGAGAFSIISWSWVLLYVGLSLTWCIWAALAAIRREPESLPMFLGGTIVLLLTILESAGIWSFVAGVRVGHLGLAAFFACGFFAVVSRFQRVRRRAREATAAILQAQEKERKRIARELHDGVVQTLLAIQLNLQMLSSQHTELASDDFQHLVDEVRNAGEDVRRLSHDLRPEALERMELVEAIRSHASILQDQTDTIIRVSVTGDIDAGDKLKDNLYRMYQESLSNAIKHASATEIDVTIRAQPNRITLQIADNGRGFAPEHADGRHGLGLLTIQERAKLLGGVVKIASQEGVGTSVSIELPNGRLL